MYSGKSALEIEAMRFEYGLAVCNFKSTIALLNEDLSRLEEGITEVDMAVFEKHLHVLYEEFAVIENLKAQIA